MGVLTDRGPVGEPEVRRALDAAGLLIFLEPELLVENMIILPVQINGKKRADVTVARNATSAEIETAVLGLDAVKRALDGKPPKKVIVVPQRIVNVVA